MIAALASKLRLTAALHRCNTRKELCACFRAVNPATQVDLERMHKWLQERATPRAPSVLDDWLRVLGIARPADWLAACSVQELLAALVERHGGEPARLMERARRFGAKPGEGEPARPRHYLCGVYACYSPAWSPYFQGRLIRGSFVISEQRAGVLTACYGETLGDRLYRAQGRVIRTSHVLQVVLEGASEEFRLVMTLCSPGPPASALCGIMSGATFISHSPQPSASRIVMIRVPIDDPGEIDATNRYMVGEGESPAADLAALGLDLPDPAETDRLIAQVLEGAPLIGGALGSTGPPVLDQVPQGWQARLSGYLDTQHLHSRPNTPIARP